MPRRSHGEETVRKRTSKKVEGAKQGNMQVFLINSNY